jgi:hypothetical protein
MSNPICYLINLNGGEFNQLLASDCQLSDDDIRVQDGESSTLVKGKFDCCKTDFLVDLTGSWTLCVLGYAYSRLLSSDDVMGIQRKVADWESALRKMAPAQVIYCFDEFLLGQWNAKHGDLNIRSQEAVAEFVSWLQIQDPLHWSLLQ